MESLPRIGVFIQRGAIETREPVLIGRKMRRYPVEYDAETHRVSAVDEAGKALRLAEPGRGGVQPRGLVAPGGIIGVLGNR